MFIGIWNFCPDNKYRDSNSPIIIKKHSFDNLYS